MNQSASIHPFGTTPEGQTVSAITLKSGSLSCRILTYGATLQSLCVPDRSGRSVDVVLGYDTLEAYMEQDGYLGATVGRYANRIAGGRFSLNGKDYILAQNNGNNHLHGGNRGFSHRNWSIDCCTADSVTLSLESKDGEEGYPGTLLVKVTYTLRDHALSIRYYAVSDADTPCNLTNHSYFNLSGHDGGPVLDQKIQLFAQYYTPSNGESIPLGTIAPVALTPMDLCAPTSIGAHIDDAFSQLVQARGYDLNYVVDGCAGTLRPAARACCEKSGIAMEVRTTQPGVQFYTANFLEEGRRGKGGCTYGPRHAFCLETQHFPDSPNQPAFPRAVLKRNEAYQHLTEFAFSLDGETN